MGFISGAINKSVFNKNSYKAAVGEPDGQNGYAVIKIYPEYPRTTEDVVDPMVIGVIRDHVEFSVAANYTEFGGVAQAALPGVTAVVSTVFDKINAGASVTGIANIGAVYASKKIYQKSGYLEISPSIRIVDWKGVGQPLLSTKLLAYLCLPKSVANVYEKYKEFVADVDKLTGTSKNNFLLSSLSQAESFVEGIKSRAAGSTGDVNDNIPSTGDAVSVVNRGGNELVDGLDDVITLRASPVPVTVEIGQFFRRSDMVIENLSFTFSKEMTRSGPLFVDVNLQISSRKIMGDIEDVGLKYVGDMKRVLSLGLTGSNATGIDGV